MPDFWRPRKAGWEREERVFQRVLITGSREWPDPEEVELALTGQLGRFEYVTVVHGDCPTGADLHARRWAEERILEGMRLGTAFVRHEPYPAPWEAMGKSAGPARNALMANLSADVCLGFPTVSSRSTVGCMNLAWAAGIPVVNLGLQRMWP